MIRNIWAIFKTAVDRAGLSVASAEHAYCHFGESLTRSAVLQHWAEGFFEGLAQGMKVSREGNPAFDPNYKPSVTFKVVGESLLVEALLECASGEQTPVVSTLSYAEAMSAASGLTTLRNTGVFALTDDQAAELIRCAGEMRTNHVYPSIKFPSGSRPATR